MRAEACAILLPGYGEKSRRAKRPWVLPKLMSALARSTESSRNFGRSFVICPAGAHRSVRVGRIGSVSVNTCIVSFVIFRPRQSRPSGGGHGDAGGGCIASLA
jgi:hypothetical protein